MSGNRNQQIGPPRFAIAIHSLVWLAQSGRILTSAKIASQVNSHATFLRRVLAQLAAAGIVDTKEGRDGGYSLKVPADELTLGDVYEAVRPECLICSDTPECGEIGKQLDHALEELLNEAEFEMINKLKKYTLEQFMENIDFSHSEQECFN
ncbi:MULTISPECIES: Rrf2 family transcriptional regulator [Peribacillus]|uniref:RrF2 family transcriptional regulator n=1 Tax=Peribacillus TaxID=2675229 RepID=UPI00207AEB94|nr:Rrf2 family transcriptional regulator [Peribacillus asahii]USK69554.1 Rrf2 family transcriptional regulator [Peribacillus asahii]